MRRAHRMRAGAAGAASVLLALGTLLVAPRASAQLSYADANALLTRNGCTRCHALDRPVKGSPSLRDIARRFRSDPNAIENLALQVHNGSVGVFGPVPMPPMSVPKHDLDAILHWIMQLPLDP